MDPGGPEILSSLSQLTTHNDQAFCAKICHPILVPSPSSLRPLLEGLVLPMLP